MSQPAQTDKPDPARPGPARSGYRQQVEWRPYTSPVPASASVSAHAQSEFQSQSLLLCLLISCCYCQLIRRCCSASEMATREAIMNVDGRGRKSKTTTENEMSQFCFRFQPGPYRQHRADALTTPLCLFPHGTVTMLAV